MKKKTSNVSNWRGMILKNPAENYVSKDAIKKKKIYYNFKKTFK